MTVRVGPVVLPDPILTASGTAGHGDELAGFIDLAGLGAVVVKSLSAEPWPGNPAPRLHPTAAGMLNSVGLQGPGVVAWRRDELPRLEARNARVVASIWGRTVDDYERAVALLAGVPACVVAIEINLSCPNLDGGRHLFAHDREATAAVMEATKACDRPRWAKLSPNTHELAAIAGVARDHGAAAVTVANTMLGLVIDLESRRPALGGGGGGLSGPAIHPIAVRAVYETRRAHPDLPIVAAGGVAHGRDAVEFLMAGANAVQVGTATFADPRAPERVSHEVRAWCRAHGVARVCDLTNAAQEVPGA
jgi:dihydroorotate dehydrogenase (NAD+) catalytic subunit